MSENSVVDRLRQRSCPICGGDCSAANPPMMYCPKREDNDIADVVDGLLKSASAIANYYERSVNVGPGSHPQREAFLWVGLRQAIAKAKATDA